jgi:hypothetical protein
VPAPPGHRCDQTGLPVRPQGATFTGQPAGCSRYTAVTRNKPLDFERGRPFFTRNNPPCVDRHPPFCGRALRLTLRDCGPADEGPPQGQLGGGARLVRACPALALGLGSPARAHSDGLGTVRALWKPPPRRNLPPPARRKVPPKVLRALPERPAGAESPGEVLRSGVWACPCRFWTQGNLSRAATVDCSADHPPTVF